MCLVTWCAGWAADADPSVRCQWRKVSGSIFCSMEGVTWERVVQGRKVFESMGCVMKDSRSVSMDVKQGPHQQKIIASITYASVTWNELQNLGIQAVEMSYLRGVCGVRTIGECNERVNNRFGM